MKKTFTYALLLLATMWGTYSCETALEEKITSKFPSGIASRIEYYALTDSGKTLVKEARYYSNGEKDSEGEIKNDKKHGTWKQWYSNGQPWIKEGYSEGIKHGSFTVYYPSGKKNYAGEYNYGVPIGTWKFWNEQGEILKETKY